MKVCLCFLMLMTYAPFITSAEIDKSTKSISPENEVNEKESSVVKNREKRAAQNYVVEQRLLTVVNRGPVRVPFVNVG